MPDTTLELHFAGTTDTQLIEVQFNNSLCVDRLVSIRGKTSGAYRNVGTFQWTSAVRALCILTIKAKRVALRGETHDLAIIRGDRGSLAASLDYAMTKQPVWLCEMFGADSSGNSMALHIIARTNSNRKRPGPVVLSLNEKVLSPSVIRVIWDGKMIENADQLNRLLINLGHESEPPSIDQGARVREEKFAA